MGSALCGLVFAVGCDEGECERRNDYPTLLALEDLDLSGNPTIIGPQARLAANGTMTVSGSADIEADLFVRGDLVVNGNPRIDGDVESFTHELQVADIADIDVLRLNNDNGAIPCIVKNGSCARTLDGSELVLTSKETLTLPSGSYFFSSIQISGQAALNTIGNVWVFTDGPASFNGGTASNQQWDTLTLVSDGTETITVNGAAEAAMHIQAPRATVKLAGTSGFLGSIVAEQIVLSGTTELYLTHGSLASGCTALEGDYDE